MKTRTPGIRHSIAATATAGALLLLLTGCQTSQKNLFVGCYGSQTITKIPVNGPNVIIASGLNYPTGLAFDNKGNLFESDQFSGNIFEFAAGTWTQTTFRSGLDQPSQLAFDAAGNLFVNTAGDRILEFTPDGNEKTFTSGSQFAGTSGIAFNQAGDLFVGNINGGAPDAGFITRVTPDGRQSSYATGIGYPAGLAFDSHGNLFVANGNLIGTITKITPQGKQSIFASGLNQPGPMTFNKKGDMVVGDQGANQEPGDITIFAPDGTKLSVFTSVSKATSLALQGMRVPPGKKWSR